MTRNAALLIGVGAAGVFAYGVWRALERRAFHAMQEANDRQVTEASEDSFPASDAPSHTPLTGSVVGNR